MKTYSLLILAFLAFSIPTFGQEEGFKVPKANHWWKSSKENPKILYTTERQKVMSPKAKNPNPFSKIESSALAVKTDNKNNLMGPKAKNKNRWSNY